MDSGSAIAAAPCSNPPATESPQRPEALEDQLALLAGANARVERLTATAKVATFQGWTLGLCAAAALPFAPFHGSSAFLCAGLGLIAFNEFRGRAGIRRIDADALRMLGWNQIGLIAVLCAYAAWKLYSGLTGPNPWAAYMSDPQLAPMLRGIESLYRLLTIALYGGLIAASLVVQGLTSAYYFRRGRQLAAYVAAAPAWILDFQRTSRGS